MLLRSSNETYKRIDSEGKEVILIGDTNCDYKKPKDGNTRKLKLIHSEFQFEQSRESSATSSSGETRTTKTLIDHVATNRPSHISLTGVVKVSITDHYMVCCIRKLYAKSKIRKLQNKVEYRSFKNFDKEAFLSDLRTIDWERATSTSRSDHNKMASNFYDLFCSALDVHAPIKIRKRVWVRSPTPWITPFVKQLMRERDRFKGPAGRDHTMWPECKRLRNKVTSELRKSVEAYFSDKVDENCNDPKGMWKVVNKVSNKDHESPSPLSVTYEGQSIDKSSEISEAFNNHFVTIGPKLAEKIECEESDDPLKYIDNEGSSADAPRFAFQKVTPDSIKCEICKPQSAGHDKIPVGYRR